MNGQRERRGLGRKDKPMGMRIRTMRRDDCPAITAIDQACFPEAWSAAGFYDAMRQPQYSFLILEYQEQAVGYIGMIHTAREGEITRIAVMPEFRRRGYGSGLLKNMLRWAEQLGLHEVFLEVRRSNEAAKGLYAQYGFHIIAERKNYYRNPTEDAIIMQLQIKQEQTP